MRYVAPGTVAATAAAAARIQSGLAPPSSTSVGAVIRARPASAETRPESLSPAELDAMVGAHEPFQAALRETGELVGFAALTDLSQARVVRRPAGGAPVVTDGPYLEAKEHLAGFYVVDCETQERAAELAATMPEAAYGGVEVRAVMEEAGLEM